MLDRSHMFIPERNLDRVGARDGVKCRVARDICVKARCVANGLAPAVASTVSVEIGGWREPIREVQLRNCIIVFTAQRNELPSDVEFEVSSGTPIVNAPLEKEHVPVGGGAAFGANIAKEIEHLRYAPRRSKALDVETFGSEPGSELLSC